MENGWNSLSEYLIRKFSTEEGGPIKNDGQLARNSFGPCLFQKDNRNTERERGSLPFSGRWCMYVKMIEGEKFRCSFVFSVFCFIHMHYRNAKIVSNSCTFSSYCNIYHISLKKNLKHYINIIFCLLIFRHRCSWTVTVLAKEPTSRSTLKSCQESTMPCSSGLSLTPFHSRSTTKQPIQTRCVIPFTSARLVHFSFPQLYIFLLF